MRAVNRLGTQVRLPDGRQGTVVYNSLIGVGIKWGLHDPDPADFAHTTGNTLRDDVPAEDWPWEPDALLRDPWPACEDAGFSPENCVGEECEILRTGLRGE